MEQLVKSRLLILLAWRMSITCERHGQDELALHPKASVVLLAAVTCVELSTACMNALIGAGVLLCILCAQSQPICGTHKAAAFLQVLLHIGLGRI